MTSVEVPKGRSNCCLPCRDRHIKCITISNEDSCVNCISHSFTCIKDSIQFRHGDNPSVAPARGTGKRQQEFDQGQVWVKPAKNLHWIDDTQELRTTYGHEDDAWTASTRPDAENLRQRLAAEVSSAGRDRPATSHAVISPLPQSTLQSPATSSRASAGPAEVREYSSRGGLRSSEWTRSPPNSDTKPSSIASSYLIIGPNTDSSSFSRWSLQSAQEAYLMQHYVQVIGKFMDVLDPDRHFTFVLPYRAASCPTLQQAIFALSARHLSRIGDFDPYVSDGYSRKVLDAISPMVRESNAINDVDLLCATVVLRLLEELDVSLTGYDNERQLKGVQLLMNAQMSAAIANGGLHQAAICIALHQEVTAALMAQRPTAPFLDLDSAFDRSFAPADDRTWAFRIILHCMDILAFCYGNDTQDKVQSQGEWNRHMEYAKKWDALQPTHFKPMYEEKPPPDSPFPLIYFHRPIQIMSAMHLHVCLILLVSHDPSLQTGYPSAGGGIHNLRRAAQALKEVDERVRYHVRAICGIALCNMHLASAMIMSTAIVKLCGEHFIGEGLQREQDSILEMLELHENKHGWPTQLVQNYLKSIWGCNGAKR
ncbi:hypothetical protein EJ05DRAFT_477958 [Pseudovirgaria hyperparasitica]|uniref:Zn(2)-C6 fungal-type domain-containing protein n=1 Tax=Pseudovirgaria hyperparasitica TaxID=470096 RepID=A0A6A6W1C5_9PEZI|nr:uncharacterized protein EJ05DRAFT_477958 [Pseudovirgaria hyperparasitica]KAF2755896.1 hypothetical protein EJ05DRAFT_477958 [Pseudovirgaria hyperparasitica]